MKLLSLLALASLAFTSSVQAEKIVLSKNLLNFDSSTKQTFDVINLMPEKDAYFNIVINEVLEPSKISKSPMAVVDDPIASGLLVSPSRSVVKAGEGKKSVSVLNLNQNLNKERVYRIDVSPVISGLKEVSKAQVKVLVGYDVLVHLQPANAKIQYQKGKKDGRFTLTNTGNSHFIATNGMACVDDTDECIKFPEWYVYPDITMTVPEHDERYNKVSYRLIMPNKPFKNVNF
jgi:hypothetical protein